MSTEELTKLVQELLRRIELLERKQIKFNPDAQALIELREMVKNAGFSYP